MKSPAARAAERKADDLARLRRLAQETHDALTAVRRMLRRREPDPREVYELISAIGRCVTRLRARGAIAIACAPVDQPRSFTVGRGVEEP